MYLCVVVNSSESGCEAGPAEGFLEWGGGGGGAGIGLNRSVSVRQLGGSGGAFSPGKVLNSSLLKWLEMHQKLLAPM